MAKTLESCVGKSYKAKKLRSGDLLVEVETEQQSKALLGLTSIADRKVTVTPHRSLNTIRGVISEDDLLESTEDEILEGLSNQGVIAVRRITFRREDQEKPSKHLVLTFNSTTLPRRSRLAISTARFDRLSPIRDVALAASVSDMGQPLAGDGQPAENVQAMITLLTAVQVIFPNA